MKKRKRIYKKNPNKPAKRTPQTHPKTLKSTHKPPTNPIRYGTEKYNNLKKFATTSDLLEYYA
jgi:hypothetical protein